MRFHGANPATMNAAKNTGTANRIATLVTKISRYSCRAADR